MLPSMGPGAPSWMSLSARSHVSNTLLMSHLVSKQCRLWLILPTLCRVPQVLVSVPSSSTPHGPTASPVQKESSPNASALLHDNADLEEFRVPHWNTLHNPPPDTHTQKGSPQSHMAGPQHMTCIKLALDTNPHNLDPKSLK
jgi:hypothetical protein